MEFDSRGSGLPLRPGGAVRKGGKKMATELKKIECDPKCGFKVISHDEKELVEIAIQHGKKQHNMTLTEKDAKGMMRPA
jgi:predicted small metal-binding protein